MKIELLGVRKLKYRPLNHLIGRTVTVSSFRTMEAEVLDAIGPIAPTELKLTMEEQPISKSLGVYGLLDLDFEGNDVLTSADSVTTSAMRELGFFNKQERAAAEELGEASDPTCMSLLIEHLHEQKTFLKLILRCETDQQAIRRVIEEAKQDPAFDKSGLLENTIGRLMTEAESRLPREFVIDDACLTNSDYVWIHRHLWL